MTTSPIVGDLTSTELDLMMRANRTDLLAVLSRISLLDGLLKAANAAGELTDPAVGYAQGSQHLINLLSASDQYHELSQVFTGLVAVPVAKNFDAYGASVPVLMVRPQGMI